MRLRKGIYYHYVHHMRYSLTYIHKHYETLKMIFDYLEWGAVTFFPRAGQCVKKLRI